MAFSCSVAQSWQVLVLDRLSKTQVSEHNRLSVARHSTTECYRNDRTIQRLRHAMRALPVGTLCKPSMRGGVTTRASSEQGSAALGAPGEEAEAIRLLEAAAAVLKRLEGAFLKSLPGDLKGDLQFAAFQLSNGPVNREVGEEGAATLTALGRALEGLDTAGATAAVAKLPSVVRGLPPGSSQRLRLGRRLVSAARPLATSDQRDLKEVATALLEAGKAIQKGCIEEEVPAPPAASKVLKFGDLQVEVTAKSAFTGALISVLFATLSWRLSLGLQYMGGDGMQYANQNAQHVGDSLQTTLVSASYFCTSVSLFAAAGLVALGLQVNSSKDE